MRSIGLCVVPAVLLLLAACSDPLHVTVLFDQVHGLKQGAPVVWEENRIGRVETVRYTAAGRFEVAAAVEENYRNAVTDRCRFLVGEGPDGAERALEMVCTAGEGELLADGAVVQGTTHVGLLADTLERQTQAWMEDLRSGSRDWVDRLGREVDRLVEEFGRAGDEARRRLRRDVLPDLERRLEELREWLRRHGREDEAEPLERKLERLKEV